MEYDRIYKGDIVSVSFNSSQVTLTPKAVVILMPCSEGDSWIFKDCRTGTVHYVSEGCTITKLNVEEPKNLE